MTTRPTVLLTFASQGLRNIAKETNELTSFANENEYIHAQILPSVTVSALTEVTKGIEKIVLYHFGGHGGKDSLLLADQIVTGIDLTRLLSDSTGRFGIPLIFLNACYSYQLVSQLTARGAKAVIATNANIDDAYAMAVSVRFYELFFKEKCTLRHSFECAGTAGYGANGYVVLVNRGEIATKDKQKAIWTLFCDAEATQILDWRLSQFTEIAFTELFLPRTDPRNYLKNQEHLKQRCDAKKGIVLLVICEVIQHITAKELALNEYYGETSADWKPFRDHTIEDLLAEFERNTGFPTTVYYYDGFDVNDEDFMLTMQDYLLEKMFVVTDGLGINERSQKIAQMVDNQVRVGGLFIAQDKHLKGASKNKVEQLIQQNFSKMTRRCVIHWKYARRSKTVA